MVGINAFGHDVGPEVRREGEEGEEKKATERRRGRERGSGRGRGRERTLSPSIYERLSPLEPPISGRTASFSKPRAPNHLRHRSAPLLYTPAYFNPFSAFLLVSLSLYLSVCLSVHPLLFPHPSFVPFPCFLYFPPSFLPFNASFSHRFPPPPNTRPPSTER